MPYISIPDRSRIDGVVKDSVTPYGIGAALRTEGELNYVLTKIMCGFAHIRNTQPNYATLNAIVGAIECAKLELYRRLAAPYEDKKAEENGDVY